MSVIRIGIVSIGFLSIFFFTPMLTLVCALMLSLRYRAWEVLFMGLCMDLMWVPGGDFWHSVPLATILAVLIVWLAEPVRSVLLRT